MSSSKAEQAKPYAKNSFKNAMSTHSYAYQQAYSTPKVSKPMSCSSTANQQAQPTDRKTMHFRPTHKSTLHTQTPLSYKHPQEFIKTFNPQNRHKPPTNRSFKPFTYHERTQHDKTNLDIPWPKDESLTNTENLPSLEAIAQEITETCKTHSNSPTT